jgi:hypothetical protein
MGLMGRRMIMKCMERAMLMISIIEFITQD